MKRNIKCSDSCLIDLIKNRYDFAVVINSTRKIKTIQHLEEKRKSLNNVHKNLLEILEFNTKKSNHEKLIKGNAYMHDLTSLLPSQNNIDINIQLKKYNNNVLDTTINYLIDENMFNDNELKFINDVYAQMNKSRHRSDLSSLFDPSKNNFYSWSKMFTENKNLISTKNKVFNGYIKKIFYNNCNKNIYLSENVSITQNNKELSNASLIITGTKKDFYQYLQIISDKNKELIITLN